jgi:glycosyltransferase involved in cell wall biosynthesis
VKIAICHEHVHEGDAIGRDITGMVETLQDLGVQAEIVAENVDDSIRENFQTESNFSNLDLANFDALLYHHSVYWEKGASLLQDFSGPVVFKYHNITPASFFQPYSELHEESCRKGREQTDDLMGIQPDALWLADSEYNRQELLKGERVAQLTEVVSPFHRHEFLPRSLKPLTDGPTRFLFVGRVVPNKGHKALVRIMDAYLKRFPTDAVLEIVGESDPHLFNYRDETVALADSLGISQRILWRGRLSDEELKHAYLNADIYLCASEHEGFCVPIVEAQSIGLPVVAARAGAVEETLGSEQLVDDYPSREVDFVFYAKVLNEVLSNSALRVAVVEHGYRNFLNRFTHERIADRFVEVMMPLLRKLNMQ